MFEKHAAIFAMPCMYVFMYVYFSYRCIYMYMYMCTLTFKDLWKILHKVT